MARMLTTAEVAEALRISRRLVVALIDRGELAATRVGARRWVIAQTTVDAYVAARTTKGNVITVASAAGGR